MNAGTIAFRCPVCLGQLDDVDAAEPVCAAGHRYPREHGVLRLLPPDQRVRLDAFDALVRRDRELAGVQQRAFDYPNLPAAAADDDAEWQERTADLAWLQATLRRHPRRLRSVVEVGPYNGWLTHHLVRMGMDATALDFFRDDRHGLGAQRHYAERWRAVQCDLRRPELLATPVDLVVLNHGLHFLPEPVALLQAWMRRVAPGGLLVVFGVQIVRDARRRLRELEALRARGERAGGELFPFRGPGLFRPADARAMRRLGLRLQPSLERPLGWLAATVDPRRPQRYRGVWSASPRA